LGRNDLKIARFQNRNYSYLKPITMIKNQKNQIALTMLAASLNTVQMSQVRGGDNTPPPPPPSEPSPSPHFPRPK